MNNYRLEQVFKLSGVPDVTFVKPPEYTRLVVGLRTPGRGIVIEGPSGIGKSTAVTQAISELGLSESVTKLSARKPANVEQILSLPSAKDAGTVVIDDFHRLERAHQNRIADFLKTLADEERDDTKLVIVGINKVGESLVAASHDLASRIDIIPFEQNPKEKLAEIVSLGQKALNVELGIGEEIVAAANGSFQLAQILCHETCLSASVLQTLATEKKLNVSFEAVNFRVQESLSRRFLQIAVRFATGKRLRKEGRAPYLYVLKWLSETADWTLNIDRAIVRYAGHGNSVSQIVEKGYILEVLESSADFDNVLHYDPERRVLTAEDPQFIYFLRNLSWNDFSEQVGYLDIAFRCQYDIALSFAGEARYLAEAIFARLGDYEVSVFYDKNEQHRILAENVEDYLGPIYRGEAALVVVLLSNAFPQRIWTRFESRQFRERFKQGEVVPVRFSDCSVGLFDSTEGIGGLGFDPAGSLDQQVDAIVSTLVKRIGEQRISRRK